MFWAAVSWYKLKYMPHIHELYDFTVTIFIVNDAGQVLLVNHPRYNMWIPPGGHVELDEDPEQALYKEIQEETGLDVEILTGKPDIQSPNVKFIVAPSYMDVHTANAPHKHISMVYFARAKSSNFILSDEHDELKWFGDAELDDPQYDIAPSNKFYAREAVKRSRPQK